MVLGRFLLVFKVSGWYFMVPGLVFMVPGGLLWPLIVTGWFFMIPGGFYPAPRKTRGPKGLRAESARAVTGQLIFFTKTPVTPERKVKKLSCRGRKMGH